jgi:hypothetical protein
MAKVVVILSSDANDQLTDFGVQLQGITLTNSSGQPVTLLSQSVGTEFVHLNGLVEPMITGTLPYDTYTAATVSVGGAQANCVAYSASGGLDDSTFAYGNVPAPDVSVSLPAPIVISGPSFGLTLRMSVPESVSLSSCGGGASYAITPAFTLAAFDLSAVPPGSASTMVWSLDARITALDAAAGSLAIQRPSISSDPALVLDVSVDANATLQGVANLSSLAVGAFIQLDGAIQEDGSVQATRIALADPLAVDVRTGPIVSVYDGSPPVVTLRPVLAQGQDGPVGLENYDFSSTAFHVSGQFSNVQVLPFVASFTADNMVPGQNVHVSSPAFQTCCGARYYAPATTMTLMPQTIDGQIVAVSISGGFTVYTVQLAADDAFVSLASQPGQTATVAQPGEVQVYTDGSTRLLNSDLIGVGGTLRFYGLVFDDDGTLRMDCAQVEDGAPFT